METTRGYDVLTFADPEDRQRVVVEWLLGTRCNYRCSYCPTSLHDGKIRWPLWQQVRDFAGRVRSHYDDRQVTFLLTGGEPTLYPDLFAAADLFHELGMLVAVLSNGSRHLEWWADAAGRLDEVILSYHAEQANRDRFVGLVAFLSRRVRVQVNLVMVPARFEELLRLADDLERAAPGVVVHRKPVMEEWRDVRSYPPQARRALLDANNHRSDRYKGGTCLKGDLVAVGPRGRQVVTPFELIVGGGNRWRGWTCEIGVETLFVRGSDVYRAVCGVGGRLGSIDDPGLRLPTEGVTCTENLCTCVAGIKAGKRKEGVGDERPTLTEAGVDWA